MTAVPPDRVAYADLPLLWRTSFDRQIGRWEGLYQADPDDSGNWTSDGRNLGTMRGVTPGALAEFLDIPDTKLTVADIKAITHERAVEIGYWGYVGRPRFDRLPANRFTEFFVDWGWGSGPITAVKAMQRLVGTTPDGVIGPLTVSAVERYVDAARYTYQGRPFDGIDAALHHAVDARIENLRAIVVRSPVKAKYLRGWTRRAEAFRPCTDETPPEAVDPLPKPQPPADDDPDEMVAVLLADLSDMMDAQTAQLTRIADALERQAS